MSDLIAANSAAPAPSDTAAQSLPVVTAVAWADPAREALFATWLQSVAAKHGLLPASVRLASADASFRRYLRIDDSQGGTRIILALVTNTGLTWVSAASGDQFNCRRVN